MLEQFWTSSVLTHRVYESIWMLELFDGGGRSRWLGLCFAFAVRRVWSGGKADNRVARYNQCRWILVTSKSSSKADLTSLRIRPAFVEFLGFDTLFLFTSGRMQLLLGGDEQGLTNKRDSTRK